MHQKHRAVSDLFNDFFKKLLATLVTIEPCFPVLGMAYNYLDGQAISPRAFTSPTSWSAVALSDEKVGLDPSRLDHRYLSYLWHTLNTR